MAFGSTRHVRRITAWLPSQPTRAWHWVASHVGFEVGYHSHEILLWMIRQPRCDRALALRIFWEEAGFRHDPGSDDWRTEARRTLAGEIIRQFETHGYPNTEGSYLDGDYGGLDKDHVPRGLAAIRSYRYRLGRKEPGVVKLPDLLTRPVTGNGFAEPWDAFEPRTHRHLQRLLIAVGVPVRAFGNSMSFWRGLAYWLGYRRHRLAAVLIWCALMPALLVLCLYLRDLTLGRV